MVHFVVRSVVAAQVFAVFLADCARASPMSALTSGPPIVPGGYIVEFETTDSVSCLPLLKYEDGTP